MKTLQLKPTSNPKNLAELIKAVLENFPAIWVRDSVHYFGLKEKLQL